MTRKMKAYASGGGIAVLAFAAIELKATDPSPETGLRQKLQEVCEEMGGVLYTAQDSPDSPAICHGKGAPLSSEVSLEEWREVLFLEGQL